MNGNMFEILNAKVKFKSNTLNTSDGLALLCARTFAGTMIKYFGAHRCIKQAPKSGGAATAQLIQVMSCA